MRLRNAMGNASVANAASTRNTSDSAMRARYGRKKGSSPVSERGAPRAGVEEGREGIVAV